MKEKFLFISDVAESFIGPRWKETIAVCLGGLILVASWHFYTSYRQNKAQAVQVLFSEALDTWEQAIEGRVIWDDVGILSNAVYEEYRGTWAAPYALVLQADVAQREGNMQEAIQLMNKALGEIPQKSPFYQLACTKKALLLVQSDEVDVRAAGLKDLEWLANDEKNQYADYALYYWGYLAYSEGNTAEARSRWGVLVERYGKAASYNSPWAALATQQLAKLQ